MPASGRWPPRGLDSGTGQGAPVKNATNLSVKLFADGADLASMVSPVRQPADQGFHDQPDTDAQGRRAELRAVRREVLRAIPDRPISFEVFSDEWDEMARQARQIAAWGDNVYVKIPITNTRGESAAPLITALSRDGIKINATALMTLAQVRTVCDALAPGPAACVSVFAGRIADAGRDPMPIMAAAVRDGERLPGRRADLGEPARAPQRRAGRRRGLPHHHGDVGHPREAPDAGKDLDEFSLDTVKMFHEDGRKAGFELQRAGAPAGL